MNPRQGGVARSFVRNGAAEPSTGIAGKAIDKRIDWSATLIAKDDAQSLRDFCNAIQ